MLTRLFKGILNGIIVFIVLTIFVAVVAQLPVVAFVAGVVAPFVIWIAVLVGVLTFLGAIPDYWPNLFK